MVAMTKKITLNATIYREVVADSFQAATLIAKQDEKEFPLDNKAWEQEFLSELKFDADWMIDAAPTKFYNEGPSDQYHSEKECKICAKLSKEQSKKNRIEK